MNAIDTNILIYAFDTAYPEKRNICQKILKNIFEGNEQGIVTNQILAEFSSAASKKIQYPLTQQEITAIIGAILASNNWKVLNYTGQTVLHAVNTNQPFWDALITQTLKENNIKTILTEDIKGFADSGITAKNPLSANS